MAPDQRARARKVLIEKFRAVAAERIERLNNAFLALEKAPDDAEAATLVLREIHSLKGEAKLMGFADINLIAHRTEDLLLYAKARGYRVEQEVADLILKGLDIISLLLNKEAGGEKPAIDLSAFLSRADQAMGQPPPDRPAAVAEPATLPEAPTLSSSREPREASSLRVETQKLDLLTALVGDLLRSQRQTLDTYTALTRSCEAWRKVAQTLQPQVRQRLRALDLSLPQQDRALMALDEPLRTLGAIQAEIAALISHALEESYSGGDQLARLEATVKDLRLLPLSSLLLRYPRAVRDLASEQGKKAQTQIVGGEIEIDKHVLDQIEEPLLHLIRNAVDHGLEGPAERRDAGKPEVATLQLSARQVGTQVEITVFDDGRGLSTKLIRRAALARGLLTQERAPALDSEALFSLLFTPGFTTREAATDLSGRGIGLDVVKSRVEALGGSVRIQSLYGQFTKVILCVPVTVALLRVLVFRVQRGTCAIPSGALRSVLRFDPAQVEPLGSREVYRHDGEVLPLSNLGKLFGLAPAADPAARRVIVVEDRGQRLALLTDQVLGEREIVQRPADPFLSEMPLVAGTAVLEYAQPATILNVAALLRLAQRSGHLPAGKDLPEEDLPARCVLLVEDSELTRDMLEDILRSMGHNVIEAANGRDALTRIAERRPDLVITDLEMPLMDGFELIQNIRATPGVEDVPIVVLTTRGSRSDKERAAELGADAYLVKSSFQEGILQETLKRFLQTGSG